ncbi:acyl-CoA dehydrogenase family protein [Roseicella frigidaeris]|uniref:Acyl-CoA dehydrogenase n=1 Tax=Roseicella frigidaeris TaxID=2230885 RepID=A0A327M2X4_9PROT|nr:acyl-CoA dehydrogenase family protein [Roseicella frigidaeris]RAI57240.1 acyl-CoA dehydrogenase [Roseicella frigidaeris]
MDLGLSERHRALQAAARDFIARFGHLSPPVGGGGGRKRPDRKALDWQALLIEHGFAARAVPRRYGGYGAEPDVFEAAIITEEFNRAGISLGIQGQGIRMLVPTLLEVGTEAQRERWIGPTIRGEVIWAQGYSEPEAGSDLAALRTQARLEDGQFIVNGQKIWTSSAHFADMMFLLCRTEPDRPKHLGISYLLLSMDSPGIEVRPLPTMTGHATFNEVFFTDVRVPADQIVLGRGEGWRVANVTLKHERMLLGDASKLMHRLHRLQALLAETRVEGRPLLASPVWRDRLMRLQGEVLAAKYHQMRLLGEAARGEESGLGLLVVKYYGSTLAWRLAALAVDALGEAGLVYDPHDDLAEDDAATAWYADWMYDLGLIIGGGSSNIQKNIIAERGLGMPREPKLQGGA